MKKNTTNTVNTTVVAVTTPVTLVAKVRGRKPMNIEWPTTQPFTLQDLMASLAKKNVKITPANLYAKIKVAVKKNVLKLHSETQKPPAQGRGRHIYSTVEV